MKYTLLAIFIITASGCADIGPILDPTYNARARMDRCAVFGYEDQEQADCAMKLQMAAEGYAIPEQIQHGALE